MISNTYTPPQSDKEAYNRWNFHETGPFYLSPAHVVMIGAVSKALDIGLFYNSDFKPFVAKELGVTQEQIDTTPSRVEGGAFGYEVYYARKYVEAQRLDALNIKIGKELNLAYGQNLGKLKLQDGKILSASTVITKDAVGATLEGKRGRLVLRTTLTYSSIKNKLDWQKVLKGETTC